MSDNCEIKILHDAQEILKERGWTKGRMENAKGEVCALGALRLAAFGMTIVPVYAASVPCYDRAIREMAKDLGTGIQNYNDYHAEKPKDILKAMRKTEKRLKKAAK